MCDKVPYNTKRHAREAVRKMGTTVRVYWCTEHNAYHTTKREQ